VPYAKPWGRTREYIEVVREIIAREGPLEHHGTHYDLPLPGGEGKALKLNFHPLRNSIPVFIGAIGRKSVQMTAEVADGWIPIFFSVDHFEESWGEHLEAGFAATGRTRADLEVSPSLSCAIDGDLEAARNLVKASLLLYLGGMGSRKTNFYVDLAHRFGFGTGDNPIFPDMYEASLRYTGASLGAAQSIMDGGAQAAFNGGGGVVVPPESRGNRCGS